MKGIIAVISVCWLLMVLLAYFVSIQTLGESTFTLDEELGHFSPFTLQGGERNE